MATVPGAFLTTLTPRPGVRESHCRTVVSGLSRENRHGPDQAKLSLQAKAPRAAVARWDIVVIMSGSLAQPSRLQPISTFPSGNLRGLAVSASGEVGRSYTVSPEVSP